MKKFTVNISLAEIENLLKAKATKKNEKLIYDNVSELDEANSFSICFCENQKYLNKLVNSQAGLIFIKTDFTKEVKTNFIECENPYQSFIVLLNYCLAKEGKNQVNTISEKAQISQKAKIGKNVHISPFCLIKDNAEIGDNTYIETNCCIAENVKIGFNCHIYSNVSIYKDSIIKDKVILHSGVVIGSDGFGYIYKDNKQMKIPQVGNVIIENEVEIGANSTVDRATIGSTIIGKGTKIDNLVQIGHNCIIEDSSIICAQTGLAGNTQIGKFVFLAGQVGVAGHLKINDFAKVGAKSGVMNDVPPNAEFWGIPATFANDQKKIILSLRKLPEIVKKIKNLIK